MSCLIDDERPVRLWTTEQGQQDVQTQVIMNLESQV